MSDVVFKHLVVFLPGIAGSVLCREGHRVWDVNPLVMLRGGAQTVWGGPGFALSGDGTSPESDTEAIGVIKGGSGLPGIASLDFYGRLEAGLCRRLGLEPGRNYREFPYDWRLDNRVAARALAAKAPGWLRTWQRDCGDDSARLVLIGHSMGGLVVRYAVEVLGLWEHTAAVVTIGTPHRGSPKAACTLARGLRGLRRAEPLTDALRGMPSVHQLLPIFPGVLLAGTGTRHRLRELLADRHIAGLDPAKVIAGERFLREIQTAAERNADDADYRERGPVTYAFAGVEQPTTGLLELRGGVLRPHTEQPRELADGDATVPHPLAYPIEWNEAPPAFTARIPARHTTLAGTALTIRELARRLEKPLDLTRYRQAEAPADPGHPLSGSPAPPPTVLTMACPEIVADEVLEFSVSIVHGAPVELLASVEPVDGGGAPPLPRGPIRPGTVTLPRPAPGCYRVTVEAADGSAVPLSDLVFVDDLG